MRIKLWIGANPFGKPGAVVSDGRIYEDVPVPVEGAQAAPEDGEQSGTADE